MSDREEESDDDDGVVFEEEQFQVGSHSFAVTTIAFMPIEVLMNMNDQRVEISGQKLWCGSLGVIEYLQNSDCSSFVENATVVELGAGTGVLGMLCKKLGASRVLLTDYDNRSLKHMAKDCITNNIDADVIKLNWFTASEDVKNLDLKLDEPLRIVAGDVLYKQPLLEPFMNTAKLLLQSNSNSEMLLCHIPRADIQQEHIIQKAKDADLKINEIDPSLWRKGSCTEYSPPEDYERARLYKITI